MSRCISILGSTGSIGRQSLDVIAACGMRAAALTANRSVRELEEQARPVSYTHLTLPTIAIV